MQKNSLRKFKKTKLFFYISIKLLKINKKRKIILAYFGKNAYNQTIRCFQVNQVSEGGAENPDIT